MLYSREGIDQYVDYESGNLNGYGVFQNNATVDIQGTTETLNIIVPTGSKHGYSVGPGSILFMHENLRLNLRAYVTKMPFFYFSGFPQIHNMPTVLLSNDDFMTLC